MAPTLEVAGIFRRHGEAFRQAHAGHLGYVERRIMGAIAGVPDGRARRSCSSTAPIVAVSTLAYNSCRNRHCPKCQGLARAQWLAQRQAELLPVPYFHVVFTSTQWNAISPTKAGSVPGGGPSLDGTRWVACRLRRWQAAVLRQAR